MKYDIGIQTFWNVPNYGTFAQAYALQKIIQELNKTSDVRQINHLDQKHFDFYYNKRRYLKTFPFYKKSFWKSFFVKEQNIGEKETNFLKSYDMIHHTEEINLKKLDSYQFNKIFLGSDIVWDYSIDVFNKDPLLFGLGYNAEIDSYAASFGTVPINAKIPSYVIDAIKNMKHISVRDEKSAEIVKSIIGYKPQVVLDPTWLWNFNNDDNIIEPLEKNYILVYGQDFTAEFIENLKKYAKKNSKKILALDCNDDHYEWCDKMISQAELSPFKWIGYFKYASCVATSTFHGITFSLIFNKRFAFCKTDFIMAKVDKFLKELNLFELYNYDMNDVFTMLNHDFDYQSINKIIDKKREESLAFLRKACK